MPSLFAPLTIRGLTLPNRIVVSPMCQYASQDGLANDWHLVHLGSRAVGGAGVVTAEATAVTPEGRISPWDLGIWKDQHIEPLARIAEFIRLQGALPAIQLAHAGRKASTTVPWEGSKPIPREQGGWKPVAPSPLPFADGYPIPEELSAAALAPVVQAFAAAARRAKEAGFQVIEIHAAHGYLIHEFLSPLSNLRHDEYGGGIENRMRLAREIVSAVRRNWPEQFPLFVRISATDWADKGWDIEQSVALARTLLELGVDLVVCSSGGLLANVPAAAMLPGYQVEFAQRIREETGILTGAVGLISEPPDADRILSTEKADVIVMAREFLRDPYWPLRAAAHFGFAAAWPAQYLRAAPPGSLARKHIYRGQAREASPPRRSDSKAASSNR
jgi:2,4-dienoyl-CoA reductase-like NADH-dependent reductase (Old Yellow Enzyme family)